MVYSREEACRAWLTHGHLHYEQLCMLMRELHTAEAVFDCILSGGSDITAELLTKAQQNKLRSLGKKDTMHAMLVRMREKDVHIMGQEDAIYPRNLL